MINLSALLKSEDLEINDKQAEKFEIYRDLIVDWNQKINLTAITETEEMNVKHFLDCLLLMKTGLLNDNQKIIDIGSGAGFPAIPLKIYNEDLEITMLDSLNKRIKFLDIVINDLNFKKINAVHARAEEFGRKKDLRESYDIATSRAVASLSLLLELTIPFVKKGGYLLAMKGPSYKEELENSENALKKLGCKLEKIMNFNIEFNGEVFERYILLIKKVEKTNDKFPRNMGQIKKKPL